MSEDAPVAMLVRYVPKPGRSEALRELVARHGRALRESGLITADPVRVWTAEDLRSEGGPYLVESFSWKDARASETAHATPAILAIWESMGEILDDLVLTVVTPWDRPTDR